MKTIKLFSYSLFVITFMYSNAYGQLPNSNFEDWTSASNRTDSLEGWSSTNIVVTTPTISLYNETTSPYQGKAAAHLATRPFGIVNYSTLGLLVNGIAEFAYAGGSGPSNATYVSGGGTPISYKPIEIRGFYKTPTTSRNNLPMAKVLLSKYNTVTNKRDTVSYTEYNFVANVKYTGFSIPLVDLMPSITPDTITTIFYSSNPTTVDQFGVNADFYLDSLTIPVPVTTNIANSQSEGSSLKIYPNPSNGIINIYNAQGIESKIDFYNVVGKKVKSLSIKETHLKLDMSGFPSGAYFMKSTNSQAKVEKFLLID